MGVDQRNRPCASGLPPGWSGRGLVGLSHSFLFEVDGYHVEILVIDELGAMDFTTQNDIF